MVKWWKPAALFAGTFVLAVSLKNDFLFFLPGFELMVYLASFLQVLWLSGKVSMRVELPEKTAVRGETFQIRARLFNPGPFPVPQVTVRLAVRVFPEQEELLLRGKLMLDSREEGCLCFSLDGEHCSCLEIRPEQLLVTDSLGIMQRRCRIHAEDVCQMFLLPETAPDIREFPDIRANFLSEDGSSERKGSSAIDISEIRYYQKGDPLKLVHWKLTARLHEMMVREMMDSASRLTWLYLNLREAPDGNPVRKSPEQWDHFVETVSAVSELLLKEEKSHVVAWMDIIGGTAAGCLVSDEESRKEMLCRLLRTDTFSSGDPAQLREEIGLDETKGTCIEIDLQGNIGCSEIPG